MSLQQRIVDAEAWNAYAARQNAKALARGLVSVEELAANRLRSQYHLDRLRSRLDKEGGQTCARLALHPSPYTTTENSGAEEF